MPDDIKYAKKIVVLNILNKFVNFDSPKIYLCTVFFF